MEKVHMDPQIGEVILRKSLRSRKIRLRVSPRSGVSVSLPVQATFEEAKAFFMKNRAWVLETLESQRQNLIDEPSPSPGRIEEWRAEAKKTLPPRLAELAGKYSFEYNRVRIKHNVSNWGSCSRKGNINLNLNLVRLPDEVRDYVLLHELCHLRHPNHGPEFHALLESLCPDHRAKEKELRKYRIF